MCSIVTTVSQPCGQQSIEAAKSCKRLIKPSQSEFSSSQHDNWQLRHIVVVAGTKNADPTVAQIIHMRYEDRRCMIKTN